MNETEFKVNREKLEVTASRIFNAPSERLFKAYLDPEVIPKWWGPRRFNTVVDKLEPKVGGMWRFVHTAEDDTKYVFSGVYKEIDEPRKLVYTFEFETFSGHVLEETVLFEENNGRTKVSTIAKYATIEDLDGMVNMDMEAGERESQERLAELIENN
jgi:uncharacterized protein YndB with AHSA1/START domain